MQAVRILMYEYENIRRRIYEGGLAFVPVCPKCGRFVKADESVFVNGLGELKKAPNATCSRCGRVEMPCEGFCD
jgi:hypothetical protein